MSVQIQLDDNKSSYKNLDFINGRIVLSLGHDESVSAVVVKLEGESKSAIERAQGTGRYPSSALVTKNDQRAGFQRQGVATEKHKILYEVSQVFPNQNSTAGGGKTTDPVYTLRAGQHEYPFKFKIPLENGCSHLPSRENRPNYDPGAFWEEEGRPHLPYRHVKRVLPPSLAGLGMQAEIRYYIKVTVHRPSRFKGNKRSEYPFRFIPLDPPKILTSSKEVYACRPYIFQAGPRGEVDARLPSPAVLAWDQNIPLRIILRKSDENEEQLYLAFLQLRLFDFTEIRASDVVRAKTNARTILSLDGLAIPIWAPSEMDTMLDSTLWDRLLLPNTVEPSFETCNLRRTYDLEVGVGLGYRGTQNAQVCLKLTSCLFLMRHTSDNKLTRHKLYSSLSDFKLRSSQVQLHLALPGMPNPMPPCHQHMTFLPSQKIMPPRRLTQMSFRDMRMQREVILRNASVPSSAREEADVADLNGKNGV
jgi:hypothetical protein